MMPIRKQKNSEVAAVFKAVAEKTNNTELLVDTMQPIKVQKIVKSITL